MDDAQRLLEWRNDPVTRHMSRNTEEVTLDTHLVWLERTLNTNGWHIYIADVDGLAVGTIRAQPHKRGIELSWTVAPEHRGQGVGRQMLALLLPRLDGLLHAYVSISNTHSMRLAENAGFQRGMTMNGFVHFRRP